MLRRAWVVSLSYLGALGILTLCPNSNKLSASIIVSPTPKTGAKPWYALRAVPSAMS